MKKHEMIQVASIYQLFVREGRRIGLLMAGLPGEVYSLLNSKSVSFLRRSAQFHLEKIEDNEIKYAFKKTIEESGKDIKKEALNEATLAVQGFPYMMQLVGYRAWQLADKKEITLSNIKEGVEMAAEDFKTRVINATINEMSPNDIKFLCAMAEDENESEVKVLEKRLAKSSGYLSTYRARLIAQGVITSERRGYLNFAIPGLREYLRNM